MKLIASREMAAKPAKIWKTLKEEGAVVVTKNGQPEGVFISTNAETWMEDIQDIIFVRARRAASELRRSAEKSGVARMSDEEIEAEILEARRARKE